METSRGILELNGSYKLSNQILEKILSRAITCKDGSISDSVSNFEILTLIHLTQICDISGFIEEYKIPDLAEVIGCSKRAAYNIIYNLENKGFISQGKSSWTGYRSIRILDNDFSTADFKNSKYINTNFSYFNHNHEDFEQFKKLSLYAKKTLLVILMKYQSKYGYRVNLESLRDYIGVCRKPKLMGYIKELSDMFDARIFTVSPSKAERVKNYNLYIHSKMPCFVPEQGITAQKDSFFKFDLMKDFRHNNIELSKIQTSYEGNIEKDTLQNLYSLTVHYNSLGVPCDIIRRTIVDLACLYGKIDELTVFYINSSLTDLIEKSS